MDTRKPSFPKVGTLPRAFSRIPQSGKPTFSRPAKPSTTTTAPASRPQPKGPTPARPRQETDRIQVGTHVRHEKFGDGVVTEIDITGGERRAHVFFENGGGEKIMLLKFVRLQIIDED